MGLDEPSRDTNPIAFPIFATTRIKEQQQAERMAAKSQKPPATTRVGRRDRQRVSDNHGVPRLSDINQFANMVDPRDAQAKKRSKKLTQDKARFRSL